MKSKLIDAFLILMFMAGVCLGTGPSIYHFWNFGFEFSEFKMFFLYWPWYLSGAACMMIAQVMLYIRKD